MLKLRNILQLSKRGKSNRDIAKELGISRQTVNNYVGRMDATGKSPEELLKLNDEELSSHEAVSKPRQPLFFKLV